VNIIPHLFGIEVREYQRAIAKSALESNTLVVLPTGLGKTIIALLVAVERLSMFPDDKVVVLAPTRPLVLQHARFFKEHLAGNSVSSATLTGESPPKPCRVAQVPRLGCDGLPVQGMWRDLSRRAT
jgi:ERCC4-related helicase